MLGYFPPPTHTHPFSFHCENGKINLGVLWWKTDADLPLTAQQILPQLHRNRYIPKVLNHPDVTFSWKSCLFYWGLLACFQIILTFSHKLLITKEFQFPKKKRKKKREEGDLFLERSGNKPNRFSVIPIGLSGSWVMAIGLLFSGFETFRCLSNYSATWISSECFRPKEKKSSCQWLNFQTRENKKYIWSRQDAFLLHPGPGKLNDKDNVQMYLAARFDRSVAREKWRAFKAQENRARWKAAFHRRNWLPKERTGDRQ